MQKRLKGLQQPMKKIGKKIQNMNKKTHILLFFLLASQLLIGQVAFTAKPSKTNLGINERLRIDFTMNKDGDNFYPPSFSGFKVVGGPSQSVSNSWVNGKRSFSKVYTYILSPTKQGRFTIGQAKITVDGKQYKTSPLKIKITAAIDKPKNANDPSYVASENIHLVAEISKSSPYINEAVTILYKLYVGSGVNVSNFNAIDVPKFADFWNQDMPIKQFKIEQGTYKGETYQYIVVKKTVLYPQKTGKINIAPLTLDVAVNVPTNRRDFFGGRLYQSVNQKVASKNRKLTVKALPEKNKPANFTGAVGQFEFDVTTTKKVLKSGESFQAAVKVTGKGNLKLFKLPKLVLPSALEVFDPEYKENVRTVYSGMRGTIRDTYTVVPKYKGNYPINPISFSYFNPKTKQYHTLKSINHVIEVLTGTTPTQTGNGALDDRKEKNYIIETNTHFRSFQTTPNLVAMHQNQFFKSNLFWALLLLPLLLLPLLYVFQKGKQHVTSDIQGNAKRKSSKIAKKYLSEAKKNRTNSTLFYESLHRSLHNYLKAKLPLETAEFSQENIAKSFSERGIPEVTTTLFLDLITSCDMARFAPTNTKTMQADYDKAIQVISEIEKTI